MPPRCLLYQEGQVDTVANLGIMYKSPKSDVQALNQPDDHTLIGKKNTMKQSIKKTEDTRLVTHLANMNPPIDTRSARCPKGNYTDCLLGHSVDHPSIHKGTLIQLVTTNSH